LLPPSQPLATDLLPSHLLPRLCHYDFRRQERRVVLLGRLLNSGRYIDHVAENGEFKASLVADDAAVNLTAVNADAYSDRRIESVLAVPSID
jgi:hypothetical protein